MTEPLKIGTVLRNGRFSYTIEKVLGAGGFGITYKVSTLVNVDGDSVKMYFAIKEHFIREWCGREKNTSNVVASGQMKSKVDDSKRDFLAEARRLSRLRHTNIVRVYEQFEENNTAYYVMEYIEGVNLRELVAENGVMPYTFMIKLFAPLCEAIRTLHYNKMTHLDIKPANVMIRRQAKRISPVLIDFGLSKHYDEEGNATSVVRTQGCSDGYAPIEQYAGITRFSPQSDVYALAASMLYCLTGRRPNRADVINEEEIRSSLPINVPVNVKLAIIRAMQRSRKQRTASVEQLMSELSTAMHTPTPVSPPIPPPVPPISDSFTPDVYEDDNRSSKGCIIAFLLVLVLCAIIIFGLWRRYENEKSNDYFQPTIDNTPGYSTNVPGYSSIKDMTNETNYDILFC